ncbi:MAG: ribosome-recycling factor [Candidatus Colwellbacteria bacterium]|nr:ribosome-recycling factor [Candidatus Colwellbacteria bacterium]
MDTLDSISKNFNVILGGIREEIMSIRTNRPSPKLVEDIRVNYLGQVMSVKQLGSISIDPPHDLIVNAWDQNSVASIINAIEAANLGVGASSQGKQIRISLPQLTEERKQELIKAVRTVSEEGRIKMRMERDEFMKSIKELKDEDELFRAKEKLQILVDTFNSGIEELVEKKIKDILE